MRSVSGATLSLLANPPPGLRSADLFNFTLRDGVTVYRWTSYDRDLTINGNVYTSKKPWLERSRWDVSNTMQVPTLEVYLRALNDGFSGGIDIKGQITNGLFDGAYATLDRVFFDLGSVAIVNGNPVINDTAGSGAGTYSTVTTVNIDAITNAANGATAGLAVAVNVGGFANSDIVRVSMPGGGTYVAWSPWGVPAYTGSPYTGSLNKFNVIPDGVAASMFQIGDNPFNGVGGHYGYNGYAAAQAAFGQRTFSGASAYKFYIDDYPITDNTGGLSILVEKAPATNAHPGVRPFGGNVANIDITGNQATINIKGKTNLLNQYAPRNLYQLGCEHAFCDAGCTLLRATFTTSYTVGSGSGGPTRTFIPWSGAAPGNASNYRYGTVTFTSGVCSGQRATVRLGDSTGLTLIHPLIGTPAIGDSFTAFEGCDKQLSSGSGQDCTARSNTQNWRAFPYVPPADSAA